MTTVPSIPEAGHHVPLDQLVAIATHILITAGLRPEDASRMASFLVFAQASGIDSHGLTHLPHYVAGIASGAVRARPEHRIVSTRVGAAVMDADDGPGVLSALKATDEAIRLAGIAGVGAVAVRNSGHFGVAAAYVDRMVAAGMVGLVLSNASPTVAPRGGAGAALGTNPIAAGFPRSDGPPVIIDLSTAVGSRARIREAAATGEAIPGDWALDESGRVTTDPAAALRGTMQALGGAKGAALGLIVELLCVTLSGGVPGTEVRPPQDAHGGKSGVSHLFVAFDGAAFAAGNAVAEKVNDVAGGIEAMAPSDPLHPIRMPGTRSAAARARAASEGILVTARLQDALRRAVDAAGAARAR
jgi:LDH2 family malate/lactate/ureidoglycolate dehydrogenase